ncbi:MAG: hypothetical protein ACNY01_10055 [Desulfobacteria bacterium]
MEEAEFLDWQSCFTESENHPELCPVCGKRLICTGIILPSKRLRRTGDPPPQEVFYDKAA